MILSILNNMLYKLLFPDGLVRYNVRALKTRKRLRKLRRVVRVKFCDNIAVCHAFPDLSPENDPHGKVYNALFCLAASAEKHRAGAYPLAVYALYIAFHPRSDFLHYRSGRKKPRIVNGSFISALRFYKLRELAKSRFIINNA